MAGVIRNDRLSTLPDYGTASKIEDLNKFKGFGVIYAFSGVELGSEGNVFCVPSAGGKNSSTQIFIGYKGTPRKIRTFNWSTQVWSDWETL